MREWIKFYYAETRDRYRFMKDCYRKVPQRFYKVFFNTMRYLKKVIIMKTNRHRLFIYLSALLVILLLSELVQVDNMNTPSYGIVQNSLSSIQETPYSDNVLNGIAGDINLSIQEIGINNGTLWEAIIDGVHYGTRQIILNLSIQPGDYSVSFYSSGAWGSSQNVNLTAGSKKIYEHFYRMENLTQEFSCIGPIESAITAGNSTAIMSSGSVQIIGATNGTFQEKIINEYNQNSIPLFMGRSGLNYIIGVEYFYYDPIFKIYSVNSSTNSRSVILNTNSLSNINQFSCNKWEYSLSAMSVLHNEAFISFRNIVTQMNSIYGIVYLNNSTFINLTGEFPSSNSSNISACSGNGNYLIGINNSWYLLNATTMNVTNEPAIGAAILQTPKNALKCENSMYIGFNGSDYIIANHARLIGFDPSTGSISLVYTASHGNISAMYANTSVILAGIQNGNNFSIIDLEKSNGRQPLFTETNASASVYGCITTIDPYGNVMFLTGPHSVYLFTDSNQSGLTFMECGLAPGTPWTITLSGKSTTITGKSIDFNNLSSGCYTYSVGSNSSFNTTREQGQIYYSKGIYVPVLEQFNAKFTFRTSNNASSFNFSTNLCVKLWNNLGQEWNNRGQELYSNSRLQFEDCFYLPAGNYSFRAIMVNSSTKGISGNITVGAGSNVRYLSFISSKFTTVFNIIDNSTMYQKWTLYLHSYCYGPNGFSGQFNDKVQGTGSKKEKLNLGDNCYRYHLSMIPYGSGQCVRKGGTVMVTGSSQTINITIVNEYSVNISESGIPAYTTQYYRFSLRHYWEFWVYSNSSGKSTFIESRCCLSPSCIVFLPDGNYSIKITSRSYYSPIGITYFNVSGKSEHVIIDFKPFYYNVFLDESGISPEYKWYVNSSSGNLSAYGGTAIKLSAINGSSYFTLTTNEPNMVADRYCHVIWVYGINKTLTVKFSKGYHVKVNEIGLPGNTMWYFGIPGEMEKSTTNTSLSVMYPVGNFTFCANSENHIFSTFEMSSHNIYINHNETINISFSEYKVQLQFQTYPMGNLSNGFSIVLKGDENSSTYYENSNYDGQFYVTTFSVINGTYSYTAKTYSRIFTPVHGITNVSGSSTNMLYFPLYIFYVQFKESGIRNITNWGIHVSRSHSLGRSYYSYGFSSLKILMYNGTYNFSAFAGTQGYGTEMTNYSMTINSTTTVFNVTFYPLYNPMISNSGISFGSFTPQFYSGVITIVGISLGTSIMMLIRKRVGNLK